MESNITFSPITEADNSFLGDVYASTRQDELAVLPWREAEKEAFLTMQFHAQHSYYQAQFGAAEFLIIKQGGRPIGRLYLDRRADEIRIIDITILPPFRNNGVGTGILETILEEGRQTGLPVRIHVEMNNPALRLYRRLGFQKHAENGLYYLMERNPEMVRSA